jgi:hypothetical protein
MGIDIYAKWDRQTSSEAEAQITGFSVEHGHVGYLREAYHGGPYATRILVREAFDAEDHEALIPAEVMRDRLPIVTAAVIARGKLIYHEELSVDSPEVRAFENFVELCARKEAETGKPCRIVASY